MDLSSFLSTADINPIGGISKTDLKRFIAYAKDTMALPILEKWVSVHPGFPDLPIPKSSFLNAVPTAELEPITEQYVQTDEVRNKRYKSFAI